MTNMTAHDAVAEAKRLLAEDPTRLVGVEVPKECRHTDERVTIKAQELKKGDRIQSFMHTATNERTEMPVGAYPVVVDADWKTKYVHVETNGRKLRFEVDTEVVVVRPVPLPEDKNLRLLAVAVESMFKRACASVPDPITVDPTKSWVYGDLEKITTAHAEWRQLYGPMIHHFADQQGSFLEVVLYTVKDLTRSVLRNEWRGQSTSEFSNAVDHKTQEVVCNFLDHGYDLSTIEYTFKGLGF